ncbi:hypothetical protein DIPPA_08779 [Diplonema papillatum]|nr:hypothetical protein DIPPA_08779 [Diplonema papillatum]
MPFSMLALLLSQCAAVSSLVVEHTNFQPVSGGAAAANPAVEFVEKERIPLADVVNLAVTHKRDRNAVKELRSTVQGSMEIGGLLYGVFQAWKDEKAVAIGPQYLWYTIVAQVAREIKRCPKRFQSVFTDTSSGKQKIVAVVGAPDEVDPLQFVSLLSSKLADPRLVDVITGSFPTPINGTISLEEVMSTVLLEAASPFFDYSTLLCGLRAIELQGTLADWDVLTAKITALSEILGGIGRWSTLNEDLLNKALQQAQTLRAVVAKGDITNDELVETCFQVETNCDSGHVYSAYGWIFNFFTSHILAEIGSPVSYVSWNNEETGRMFYQAYGLTHGNYDARGVLQMSFSRWTFEVFDSELFAAISMAEENNKKNGSYDDDDDEL